MDSTAVKPDEISSTNNMEVIPQQNEVGSKDTKDDKDHDDISMKLAEIEGELLVDKPIIAEESHKPDNGDINQSGNEVQSKVDSSQPESTEKPTSDLLRDLGGEEINMNEKSKENNESNAEAISKTKEADDDLLKRLEEASKDVQPAVSSGSGTNDQIKDDLLDRLEQATSKVDSTVDSTSIVQNNILESSNVNDKLTDDVNSAKRKLSNDNNVETSECKKPYLNSTDNSAMDTETVDTIVDTTDSSLPKVTTNEEPETTPVNNEVASEQMIIETIEPPAQNGDAVCMEGVEESAVVEIKSTDVVEPMEVSCDVNDDKVQENNKSDASSSVPNESESVKKVSSESVANDSSITVQQVNASKPVVKSDPIIETIDLIDDESAEESTITTDPIKKKEEPKPSIAESDTTEKLLNGLDKTIISNSTISEEKNSKEQSVVPESSRYTLLNFVVGPETVIRANIQNVSPEIANKDDVGKQSGNNEKSKTQISSTSHPNTDTTNSASILLESNGTLSETALNKIKDIVPEPVIFCDMVIDHFSKLRTVFAPVVSATPKGRGRADNKKKSTPISATTPATPSERGNKRRSAVQDKSANSTPVKVTEANTNNSANENITVGDCVLARWSDKKYYAGKVGEIKANNKFSINFEDGATKVLTREQIVFGRKDVLPILDHQVNALIEADTYSIGLVMSFKRNSMNRILYTVVTNSDQYSVTASEIYLEEDQAKQIQKDSDSTWEKIEIPPLNDLPAKSTGSASSSPAKSSKGQKRRLSDGQSGGVAAKVAKKSPAKADTSPQPGFSGGTGRSRRIKRNQPPPISLITPDTSDDETSKDTIELSSPKCGIEAVEGVQPELQTTSKELMIDRMAVVHDFLDNDHTSSMDRILGPMPKSKTLFKGKHFLLTVTVPLRNELNSTNNEECTKVQVFSMCPLIKDHLQKQLEAGGGKVHRYFEDVPKTKYKQCKLIASYPNLTAKYIQCLAANIQAIIPEWIIECCKENKIVNTNPYKLPAGWSLLDNKYINWNTGRSMNDRPSTTPLKKVVIAIGKHNPDFFEFWSRVCKLAGATLRIVSQPSDITGKSNYDCYLTDSDHPEEIIKKVEHLDIPVVSTVWVQQCLINGLKCEPTANVLLSKPFEEV